MDPQAFLVGQVQGNRLALGIEDATTGDPVQPLFAPNGTEVFAQAVKHGDPGTRWQVQRAGLALGGGK
ncbi:hypothetical protein D3C78_1817860 [compost metagenome]